MPQTPMKVGILGSGAISGKYLENSKKFEAFEVVACADMRPEAAQARAEEYGVRGCTSVEEMLADPEIELVINLTPHKAHGAAGLKILEAGKHLYNEKPLAVQWEEGRRLLDVAQEKGLRVGCAPDTFFGGGWQTARKLIDDGAIGEPVGAFINFHQRTRTKPGQTRPNSTSFYLTDYFEFGVGALFDRGPYYLTALINLLGPARRVTGSARKTWPERERFGEMIPVNAPTHIAGVMDLANGAVCTILTTIDVYPTGLPHMEIYGSEGSLRLFDPNNFTGPVLIRTADSEDLAPVDVTYGYQGNSRGVGVADMARAIQNGRPHRANGAMAFHVLDIIHALHNASSENRHVELKSDCDRPAPLPEGLEDWMIDN